MTLGVVTAARTAWVQTLANLIDAGSTGGKIKFYTATRPATGAAVTSQTLLGTVRCATACMASVTNGVGTFDTFVEDSNAAAGGDATWARVTDSDDNFVCDVSVGTSDADIILNSITISAGGIIRITSGTLTAGNA
jgi:hypothetical protein